MKNRFICRWWWWRRRHHFLTWTCRQYSHLYFENSVDQNSVGKIQFHFLPVSFLPVAQFHQRFLFFFLSFILPFEIAFYSFSTFNVLFSFLVFFFRFSLLFRLNLNYFYLLLDFRLKRYSMTKWNSNHINYVTKCADYTLIECKINVVEN